MMNDPTQQQSAPGSAPEQEEPAGTVCIAPQGNGTFTVYREEDEQGQNPPVSLDEALNQARTMLGSEGAEKGMDEATALIDGFKGARGQVGA